MAQSCVTNNSTKDGTVLWELQEQKCQQHVYQHSNVEQPTLAGWMVLILQWKMVKFPGLYALVIKKPVANIRKEFQLKIADPTSSTNFTHLLVPHATVVQTECEAKNSRNKRTHKLILTYTYFRDFAESTFFR